MPPSNLRIAFFGTDLFSVASLAKLAALKRTRPNLISQLDVFTRSIKPTGRNLKQYVDLPVGKFALKENLRVFRVDSLAEIATLATPEKYHLAVAVSYGKLIPKCFLESLPYGGLNIHPSKLPQFSGSSPIQYALINDCKSTAVTVQTLHPTKFDHGDIVSQSPSIEILDSDNFASLQAKLSCVGADLLEDVITTGRYENPEPLPKKEPYSLAAKLTPSMAEVKWGRMTSRQVRRLYDALGPLYTYKHVDVLKKKKPVQGLYKVILDDMSETASCSELGAYSNPGDFALSNGNLVVKTSDSYITVRRVKFQYCGLETATEFMKHLKKRAGDTHHQFLSQEASAV